MSSNPPRRRAVHLRKDPRAADRLAGPLDAEARQFLTAWAAAQGTLPSAKLDDAEPSLTAMHASFSSSL